MSGLITRLRREEDGSIIALFLVLATAVLLVSAFVIDVGNWWEHRRHLQVQVDSGVLATGRDFSFCFVAPDTANAKIQQAARKYAGDPAVAGSYNPQVGDPNKVSMVLNGTDWPPAGIDAFTPFPDPARMPCELKSLEIKAKDSNIPAIFSGLLPDSLDFVDARARAKVEIRKVKVFKGILPWAVPDFAPKTVAAIFVNEGSGGVISTQLLVDGGGDTLNGRPVSRWEADAQVAAPGIAANTGVVILTSSKDPADVDLTGTLDDICNNQTQTRCFAGTPSNATSGLRFIKGMPASPPVGSANNPVLQDVQLRANLGAGGCTDDSAPYFVLNGGCTIKVRAKLDFGTGTSDPTLPPTSARAFVVGVGCPTNGGNKGCPMTWVASDQYFETSTPSVASVGGRLNVSICWETLTSDGCRGGGGAPVSLANPTQNTSTRTAANPLLAGARASRWTPRTLAGSSPTSIVFQKTVAGGPNAPGDWTIEIRDNATNALVDSFPAPASGTHTTLLAAGTYKVIEIPGPSVTLPYTMTTPGAGGNDCNASNATTALVTVGTNQARTCNMTNTFHGGTLIVRKTVTNDGGGTNQPGDWTMVVSQGATTVASFPGVAAGRTVFVAPGTYTVTETGGNAAYSLSYQLDCNGLGSVTLAADETKSCTLVNNDPGGPAIPSSGVFANVAHPYSADDRSDPIYYVSVTSGGIADNTETIGSTPILHVAVAIKPDLQAGQAGETPILLRFASPSGSLNQALDCDAGATFEEEIKVGCQQPYKENERGGDCSNYGNGDLPPSPLDPDPANAPDCVAAKTGDVTAFRKALHERFELPCTDNLWPENPNPTNLPPDDDPRWVTLVITDFTSFGGSGATIVPVTHFAGFYATGWDIATGGGSSSTQGCPDPDGLGPRKGNDPHPLGYDEHNDNGDVWGHFITIVRFVPGGTESEDKCAFDEVGLCTAILTE